MSGHFVYEIDERKLRTRLLELEVEQKSDSWSNFEAYFLATNKPKKDRSLQNFNVPISMNIILPVLFGGLIIVIAVFLFKFISIKNPSPQQIDIQSKPLEKKALVDSVAIKLNALKLANKIDSINKLKLANDLILERKNQNIKDSIKQDSILKQNAALMAVSTKTNSLNKREDTTLNRKTNIATGLNNANLNNKDTNKAKRKKQKKITNDSSANEKALEELPPSSLEENEASLKPN